MSAQTAASKQKVAHDTLCKFIQITIEKNNQNNLQRLIKELDCVTSYKPESIRQWYSALCDCVSLLPLNRYEIYGIQYLEDLDGIFPEQHLKNIVNFVHY